MEFSPVVANYLRHVGTNGPLSRHHETTLVDRARRQEPGAVDELVRQHLAFVIRVATEFRGRGVPFEDLINEACVGLLKAVRRFDSRNGARFMTYASFWMRKAVLDALLDQPRMVRVPRYQRGLGRTIPREVWLDAPIDSEDARTLGERLPDSQLPHPATAMIEAEKNARLHRALLTLRPRERSVLALRFGLHGQPGMTLLQVGTCLDLSRERVRQIESAALARLRRSFLRDHRAADVGGKPSNSRTPLQPAFPGN